MAYITFADFRSATVAEYCQGLTLTTTEASDTNLPIAIARFSQRFDDFTNDHFESASLTLELDGEGEGRIYLPKRCTAVSTVKIRDENGTLTTQDTTATASIRPWSPARPAAGIGTGSTRSRSAWASPACP
jgi:hypothetical protein